MCDPVAHAECRQSAAQQMDETSAHVELNLELLIDVAVKLSASNYQNLHASFRPYEPACQHSCKADNDGTEQCGPEPVDNKTGNYQRSKPQHRAMARRMPHPEFTERWPLWEREVSSTGLYH